MICQRLCVFAFLVQLFSCGNKNYYAQADTDITISFFVSKKLKSGVYVFDFENEKNSSRPLCFCLRSENAFPKNCTGDVVELRSNISDAKLVPSVIGSGYCNVDSIQCGPYATRINIQEDYFSSKDSIKLYMRLHIPKDCSKGEDLIFKINWRREDLSGNFVLAESDVKSVRIE